MNTKQQGDLGVAQAIAYYVGKGWDVSIPMTDSTRYDLIVDDRIGHLYRVQVKCANHLTRHGVPEAGLSTQGGNQSWQGSIKKITADETDLVFIYYIDGKNAWEFPSNVVAGKRSINLGKLQESFKVF